MAKVKAPLFSFGARGQLAETLVYFPWKGIDCVRSYVIPANPKSAGQQTQRGYMSVAVDDWHTIGIDADDLAAWNRHAATRPSSMSGFNSFCKDHLDMQVAAVTPDMGFDGGIVDDADDTFSGAITEGGSADGANMHWGTSPTSLINTEAGAETNDTWDFEPAGNVAGQTIYARFEILDGATVVGTTGIFRLVMAP